MTLNVISGPAAVARVGRSGGLCLVYGARGGATTRQEGTPMAVSDLMPSRYYAFAGAIAVTALASAAALFNWRWLFVAGAAGR